MDLAEFAFCRQMLPVGPSVAGWELIPHKDLTHNPQNTVALAQ